MCREVLPFFRHRGDGSCGHGHIQEITPRFALETGVTGELQ
jgi:hypothetical protein